MVLGTTSASAQRFYEGWNRTGAFFPARQNFRLPENIFPLRQSLSTSVRSGRRLQP